MKNAKYENDESLILHSMIFYGFMGLFSIFGCYFAKLPMISPLIPLPHSLFWPTVAGLLIGLLLNILTRFFLLLPGKMGKMIQDMGEESFEIFSHSLTGHDIFMVAMLSGFGEELLFRGFLTGILEKYWGATLALLLTSVIFGLIHWPFNKKMRLWPYFAFTIALLFGIIRNVEGGIVACIFAHFSVNYLNMAMANRQFGKENNGAL